MMPRVAVAALLRRAWLLAGVLAVIGGLFGMHVMPAGHTGHAAGVAASPEAAAGHSAGHTAVGHPNAGHAVGHSNARHTALESSDVCGPACPSLHESGTSCTPAANSGSLTVLPPAGAGDFQPVLDARDLQTSGYSYLPPSPTPCELSISRT